MEVESEGLRRRECFAVRVRARQSAMAGVSGRAAPLWLLLPTGRPRGGETKRGAIDRQHIERGTARRDCGGSKGVGSLFSGFSYSSDPAPRRLKKTPDPFSYRPTAPASPTGSSSIPWVGPSSWLRPTFRLVL